MSLLKSVGSYRRILNSIDEAVLIVDQLAGTVFEANRKAEELFGFSGAGPRQTPLSSLFGGGFTPQEITEFLQGAIRGGKSDLEVQIRPIVGRPFWAQVEVKPLSIGDLEYGLILIRDITSRKNSEQDLHLIAQLPNESPSPVMRITFDGNLLYANKCACRILESWQYRHTGLLPAELLEGIAQSLSEDEILKIDIKADFSVYSFTFIPMPEEGYVNVYGKDITEKVMAETSNKLSDRVFHAAGEGIMVTDPSCTILNVNDAFCRITGYAKEEVLGHTPRLFHSGRQNGDFYSTLWKSINESGTWQGEIWNKVKDGRIIPEWLTITSETDDKGEAEYYIGVFSDITAMKQSEERIQFLAYYDLLTELPNKRYFNEKLEHEVARARRNGARIAVIFFDLDRFKEYNDTLGHAAGDAILIEATRRIRRSIRETDIVARVGGDEFGIAMPDIVDTQGVIAVTNKIRSVFAEPFVIGDRILFLSASIGIALFPDDETTVAGLVKSVETAMYYSKDNGKDRFTFFSNEMNTTANRRLDLEMRLRKAVDNADFRLYLQPRITFDPDAPMSFEALLRWIDAEKGMISPGDFIPLSEETGLIQSIGLWVVESACLQITEIMRDADKRVIVSVNVSAIQFEARDFLDSFLAIIRKYPIDPSQIEVEVTESLFMKNVDHVRGILTELRKQGIKIFIDDFGTGYSSLAYLRNLPIDGLKIDRSFIRDVPDKEDANAIVRSIIGLGHNLGLVVVAEGVETKRQLEFLKAEGCDEIQGFLFSPALPGKDALEYFRNLKKI